MREAICDAQSGSVSRESCSAGIWFPGSFAMSTTSISLLERLRLPDEQVAWAQFVELYTPLIFYWARNAGLQSADAADLVQDVFTVLVKQMPTFVYDEKKSFRGWLRMITLNKWRERLRKRPLKTLDDQDRTVNGLTVSDDREAIDEAEYRHHLLRSALQVKRAEFAPATWQACWEIVISGRSPAEVATDLGMTIDAVYVAKSRVLRRLREELAGLLD
jgi:RNA polymerase sigma-70 factor (ECF subfamily)